MPTRQETIYNGIELPEIWPPCSVEIQSNEPMPVPYLKDPPEIINIDVGRQLFVDDFLIETTTLKRQYHYPKKYLGNPILKPETLLETGDGNFPAVACPKSGGVWFDYERKVYRMWYEAGWCGCICLAESHDGIHWLRPELDIFPGTNRVSPFGIGCDSWTVVHDYYTGNEAERYKMFIQEPCGDARAMCFTSPDGIHWSLPTATGYAGDRSTMFYNPFRKKWCFSLRSGYGWKPGVEGMRARHYAEGDDFRVASQWGDTRPGHESLSVPWAHTDRYDLPHTETNRSPQLYNLDAVAYESIMLGVFQVHHGPANEICDKMNMPKITDLNFAYSRDGFHWYRPDRTPAIRSERCDLWDCGYVQSLGNICTVDRDRITFFFAGFQGAQGLNIKDGMYHRGATGIAHLRRDGFASMNTECPGYLTTRLLKFSGEYLFVNIDTHEGALQVEILDDTRAVISPFSADNCIPVSIDSTQVKVYWKGECNLGMLKGRSIHIRFKLNQGKIYSFWLSRDKTGHSGGFLAGGGPDYHAPVDI